MTRRNDLLEIPLTREQWELVVVVLRDTQGENNPLARRIELALKRR